MLQSAVQKLKTVFDEFEMDLQRTRERVLVDQGLLWHIRPHEGYTVTTATDMGYRIGIQLINRREEPAIEISITDDRSSKDRFNACPFGC